MELATATASDLDPRVAADFLDLPSRTSKPRSTGLTHVLDTGLSVGALESLLESTESFVDIVKFGWGTAYVTRSIARKVKACERAGVHTCVGGTLLEIAVAQRRLDRLLAWIRHLRIDCIEVSNGALGMAPERKRELIRELSDEFTVLSEVGSKGPEVPVARAWVSEMAEDLEAGASWVIAEGRESGTVGLFDASGAIRRELVDEILSEIGSRHVIFEAPQRRQQSWLIMHAGSNLSLGNVASGDVISLETLRLGLRADTIALSASLPGAGCRVTPGVSFVVEPRPGRERDAGRARGGAPEA